MKNLLLFSFASLSIISYSQQLNCEKGSISFISNAQLELIQASSEKLTGIIDISSNQFAFKIDIKSFRGFNSNLQREHFIENYMETEKYPSASFVGKIIESIDFSKNGEYEVRAKGELAIHGQTQTRIIKSKITIQNSKITIIADFKVPLSDHNISIPRIVNQKIATEIDVSMQGTFVRP
jgi:polyisoprenoid-binding protein YceI